jgi:hypothetical protein
MRMPPRPTTLLTALTLASLIAFASAPAPAQVAVAWNNGDASAATVGAMRSRRPWSFLRREVALGPDLALAPAHRGLLAALSHRDGSITLIDRRSWRVRRTIELGAASQPEDIAIVGPCRGYVTRRTSGRLLRVDLCTGATAETVDLSPFADNDGNPDLGASSRRGGLRRRHRHAPHTRSHPAPRPADRDRVVAQPPHPVGARGFRT